MFKQEVKLCEVADIIMGQSPDSSSYNTEEVGLPFLQGCAEFQDLFPKIENYCTSPKKISPAGSILMSVRAPVGDMNFTKEDVVIGRGLAGIVPRNIDKLFLYYSLLTFNSQLRRVSQGSTFQAISSSHLQNFKIFRYDHLVESEIGRLLHQTDSIIQQTKAIIKKYEAIKQGLMQDLFSRGVDVSTGQLRPSREEAPELYVETDLGWIPKEWRVEYLGNLVNITTGGRDTQDKNDDGQYPFFVRSSKVEFIDSYSFDCEGILTAGDGVGTGKVFHYINGKFDFHQRVYLLHNFIDEVNPKYLYEYFKLNFIHRVEKYSAKTTVDSVRMVMISHMQIPMGSSKEQNIIQERLSQINKQIEIEYITLQKYEAIKQGLMQDLLTGKVRVNVAEEQI